MSAEDGFSSFPQYSRPKETKQDIKPIHELVLSWALLPRKSQSVQVETLLFAESLFSLQEDKQYVLTFTNILATLKGNPNPTEADEEKAVLSLWETVFSALICHCASIAKATGTPSFAWASTPHYIMTNAGPVKDLMEFCASFTSTYKRHKAVFGSLVLSFFWHMLNSFLFNVEKPTRMANHKATTALLFHFYYVEKMVGLVKTSSDEWLKSINPLSALLVRATTERLDQMIGPNCVHALNYLEELEVSDFVFNVNSEISNSHMFLSFISPLQSLLGSIFLHLYNCAN